MLYMTIVIDYGHIEGCSHVAGNQSFGIQGEMPRRPDEVERTRQAVVITKRGKPVAELVPHTAPKRNARGILKGRLEIVGDIISPIDVEWEALK
jgi:antitoxin (DNA-binding transcriptional repressor) of toxin-antitoxin stability system